jgi:hypothetical protein
MRKHFQILNTMIKAILSILQKAKKNMKAFLIRMDQEQ